MTAADFAFICSFVHRQCGIVIGADKQYLVETRLAPVLRQKGLGSIGDIVALLKIADSSLESAVIEAMTTNETMFFRDRSPFEHFQHVILPHLMGARPRGATIRIWCAACSSGQEPYSLAMILEDLGVVGRGWNFQILATDISEAMIERGRAGVYSQFEVQRGLPIRSLIRFFAQEGTNWRIDQRLRERVEFRQMNLQQDFRRMGEFDMIFCRNVLIYFDDRGKAALLGRLAQAMRPDGFLVLGTAESPHGLSDRLARHVDEAGLIVRANGPFAARQHFTPLPAASSA